MTSYKNASHDLKSNLRNLVYRTIYADRYTAGLEAARLGIRPSFWRRVLAMIAEPFL